MMTQNSRISPRFSNVMLGTSQFGSNYGIANTVGKPTFAQVCEMLSCAHENGINCLDTAAAYGDSEATIGNALTELGLSEQFLIVTKIPLMGDQFSSQSAVDAFVEEAVVASLRRLKREQLDVCLFHVESNFRYIEALLKLRQKELVQAVGCSVMTAPAALEILKSGQAQVVQIPASVLDHRFLRARAMEAAATAHATLVVRSIYLQGLLLMDETQVPAELAPVLAARRILKRLAQQAAISLEELAMRFALSLPAVSSVVVGAETLAQVQHNARLASKGPLSEELYHAVLQAVPALPDSILMPNLWSQRMADVAPILR